jgi:hypothetical protein
MEGMEGARYTPRRRRAPASPYATTKYFDPFIQYLHLSVYCYNTSTASYFSRTVPYPFTRTVMMEGWTVPGKMTEGLPGVHYHARPVLNIENFIFDLAVSVDTFSIRDIERERDREREAR